MAITDNDSLYHDYLQTERYNNKLIPYTHLHGLLTGLTPKSYQNSHVSRADILYLVKSNKLMLVLAIIDFKPAYAGTIAIW
jgi:hypothetical protein